MTDYDDYLAYVQSLAALESEHSSALARAEARLTSAERRLRTEHDENSSRVARLAAVVEDQRKQAEALLKAAGLAGLLAEEPIALGGGSAVNALPDLAAALAAQRSAVERLREVLAARRSAPAPPAAARTAPEDRRRGRRRRS